MGHKRGVGRRPACWWRGCCWWRGRDSADAGDCFGAGAAPRNDIVLHLSLRAAAGGKAISCSDGGRHWQASLPLSRVIAAGASRPRNDMGGSGRMRAGIAPAAAVILPHSIPAPHWFIPSDPRGPLYLGMRQQPRIQKGSAGATALYATL